jgi:hypothetical protein
MGKYVPYGAGLNLLDARQTSDAGSGNNTKIVSAQVKVDNVQYLSEAETLTATEYTDEVTTEDKEDIKDSEEISVIEDELTSSFDDSLLEAEPIYEFDYKGRHIATYLTYSLIFDGDNVTVRNMQLFVKNGQLFALNAPDDIVPGCVMIDSYQGSNYMSVLAKTGQIVDLMDTLNYPEDFKNYDIKAISSNLYSDLTYLQVEYNDGSIVAFNYLTGTVIYEQEAEEVDDSQEITDSLSEFISYISGFFRRTIDNAYSEVSTAYQNALDLKDYLTGSSWSSWLKAGSESEASVDDGDELITSLDNADGTKSTGQGSDAERSDKEDEEDGSILDELNGDGISDPTDGTASGITGTYGEISDDELEAGMKTDGTGKGAGNGSKADETGAEGILPEGDAEGGFKDGPVSDTTGTALETAEGDVGVDGDRIMSESSAADGDGDGASEESSTAGSSADEEPADSTEGDLIIAYDGGSGSYALYSEDELLGNDESVTSVDKQMEDYLANGGSLESYEKEFPSLSVSGSQKNGIYIILITGTAIGGMLIILFVQKTKRHSKKSDKFRKHR